MLPAYIDPAVFGAHIASAADPDPARFSVMRIHRETEIEMRDSAGGGSLVRQSFVWLAVARASRLAWLAGWLIPCQSSAGKAGLDRAWLPLTLRVDVRLLGLLLARGQHVVERVVRYALPVNEKHLSLVHCSNGINLFI